MKKDIVEFIVKKIVDNANEVSVSLDDKDDSCYVSVSVAKNDLGKIIGRNGRVIKTIKTILSSIARKENKEFDIKIQ